MYPADFKLPMVAPEDLGWFAAELMTEPVYKTGLHYVEGPVRYSANDVATGFSEALGRAVDVRVVPRDKWEAAYRAVSFSAASAKSYANMTKIAADEQYHMPDAPMRSHTSLRAYIQTLVERTQL